MDNVSINRAIPADAKALATFAARLFRETYSADLTPSDLATYLSRSFGIRRQQAEITDPLGAVFVASADGDIVGYSHLAAADIEGALFLNRLYVDANWRGLGLASRLLEEAKQECRRCGVSSLRLTVYEKNTGAIAFYKRSGFIATGTTTFTVGEEVQCDLEMTMPVPQH
ncbi:GNAT family N-acetyltransferase [Mesorhizobium sp. 131-2-1]|uniref:GNAT family N-acetyltransferase n=1 Tax=Mesorhizobium sp. 131-2-1 TaxID=2744518 RepID=UPI0019266214|nr:GNAT family N-acetyltransferase [Mesorhizobium sp. 131-2-1]BCG96728.1 spermidine/spermine N(1)-acetyltransferase [Mesorhizobium sp. 131-2-1]